MIATVRTVLGAPRAALGRFFCPSDQQERSDRIEGARVTTLAKSQSSCWAQPVRRVAVCGKVVNAEQQADDRQIDSWGHQRRDPSRHTEAQGEVPDVAESEQERQPHHDCHDHGQCPDVCGSVGLRSDMLTDPHPQLHRLGSFGRGALAVVAGHVV